MAKDVFGFDVNFLKQVKSLFKETNIEEVEIEDGENLYLRVSRKKAAPIPVVQTYAAPVQQQPLQQAVQNTQVKVAAKPEVAQYDDEKKYYKIKSPIVGTFYEAASPGAPAFIKVGDMVSPDSAVCIIEAMKAMNEIKAEVKGKVVQILKQNGGSVLANDVLFIVEKQ